jgi:hypothetical protein
VPGMGYSACVRGHARSIDQANLDSRGSLVAVNANP